MSKTLSYYNQNAVQFAEGTISVDFSATQEKFAGLLKPDAYILDLGCGSGRDTKYFLSRGFRVDATDGSVEMCRLASAYTGIPVKQMLFSELSAVGAYDGIWACSSILHLPKTELKDVLQKIGRALKPGGVLYTSFKYGTFEGERNGRYFTDFTEETYPAFAEDIITLRIEEFWLTGDVRPGRGDEKWLNLIMRRI